MKTILKVVIVLLLFAGVGFQVAFAKEKGSKIGRFFKGSASMVKKAGKAIVEEPSVSKHSDITLFGEFEWNDSIFEVVAKLNKIETVSSIKATVKKDKIGNLKGIQSKSGIANKLSPTLLKTRKRYYSAETYWGPTIKSDGYLEAYEKAFSKEGKQKSYLVQPVRIVAKNVVIQGVPFTISFDFVYAPGFAIKHPQKAFSDKKGYVYSYALTNVYLHSESSIIGDKFFAISNIIDEKYSQFGSFQYAHRTCRGCGKETAKSYLGSVESDSSRLNVNASIRIPDSPKYSLHYETFDSYRDELKEVYRRHVASLESKKYDSSTDMSKGL